MWIPIKLRGGNKEEPGDLGQHPHELERIGLVREGTCPPSSQHTTVTAVFFTLYKQHFVEYHVSDTLLNTSHLKFILIFIKLYVDGIDHFPINRF